MFKIRSSVEYPCRKPYTSLPVLVRCGWCKSQSYSTTTEICTTLLIKISASNWIPIRVAHGVGSYKWKLVVDFSMR